MKALVYHGPGNKSWDEVPDPKRIDPTDAIVQIDATTPAPANPRLFRHRAGWRLDSEACRATVHSRP
jgi:threonine dehydrogenase-like Zn-dependent dehydrogenase